MLLLISGIVLFLGAHTLSTLRNLRLAMITRLTENGYKAVYSVISLIGFVLIVKGFGDYRASGMIPVWDPPAGLRHVALLLMWFAFVALAAMNKRPGRIRGWLRHPMLVAIKIWALAHLLANGDLGSIILFGSFLAWAVYDRISVKRRGDLGGERQSHFTSADAVSVGAGTLAYVAMIFLHPILIGVRVI